MSAVVGRYRLAGVKAACLVLDGRRYLLELVGVLTGVVSAEEQLTTGAQLDADVCLGSAAVAAV